MQNWYYIDKKGEQVGPISSEDLQNLVAKLVILRNTQVWTDSLPEWVPASKVGGLFQTQQHAAAPPSQPATPSQDAAPLRTEANAKAAIPTGMAAEPQRPRLVDSTPMIASTPTTAPTQPAVANQPPVEALPAPALTPAQPVAAQHAANPLLTPAAAPAQAAAAPANPLVTPAAAQPAAQPATSPLAAAQPAVATPALGGAQPAPTQGLGGAQPAVYPYATPGTNPHAAATGEQYPATIKKGGSFGLLMGLFLGGIGCILFALMSLAGAAASAEAADASAAATGVGLSLLLLLAGYAISLIMGILFMIYIARAWKSLQPGGASMTGGKAIGFCFIPVFQLIWIFIMFNRLAKEWNAITSRYENTKGAPKFNGTAFMLYPLLAPILFFIVGPQICKGITFMSKIGSPAPAGGALGGLGGGGAQPAPATGGFSLGGLGGGQPAAAPALGAAAPAMPAQPAAAPAMPAQPVAAQPVAAPAAGTEAKPNPLLGANGQQPAANKPKFNF